MGIVLAYIIRWRNSATPNLSGWCALTSRAPSKQKSLSCAARCMSIGMQIPTLFAQFLHGRHEIDFVRWRKIMVSLRLKADATPTRFDKEKDRSKLRSRVAVNMVFYKNIYLTNIWFGWPCTAHAAIEEHTPCPLCRLVD